jgi:hypothetical protein
MGRHATLASLAVATALAAALPGAAAPAKESGPRCRGSTAIGERPHELAFRVSCNFEMTSVDVYPAKPAIVRAVRHHPRLRHPDPEDHFRCWRHENSARCRGAAGSQVRLTGALRMHGDRCATKTAFIVSGGMDCDDPHYSCPAIGYIGQVRDPSPSGCG